MNKAKYTVKQDVGINHREVVPWDLPILGWESTQIIETNELLHSPVCVNMCFVGILNCGVENLFTKNIYIY